MPENDLDPEENSAVVIALQERDPARIAERHRARRERRELEHAEFLRQARAPVKQGNK